MHTYTYARALQGLDVSRVSVPRCVRPCGLALPLFSFTHTRATCTACMGNAQRLYVETPFVCTRTRVGQASEF